MRRTMLFENYDAIIMADILHYLAAGAAGNGYRKMYPASESRRNNYYS